LLILIQGTIDVGDVLSGFLFILTHISLDLFSLGSAKAYIKWGGKLNCHLMASCVRNICTKNYQNLIMVFQLLSKMLGMLFWDTVYSLASTLIAIRDI